MPDSPVTVAIHQANYIPWLGYFHKMAHCDYFVYLDTVQYPRGQSFSPRNRIKTPNGVTFLTIPVKHPPGKEGKALYTEIEFADARWKQKHLKTVMLSYKRAPFFEEIYPFYEQALLENNRFLELNIALIEAVAVYLGIPSKRMRLSEMLDNFGQKTDLIVDICKQLGADTYLSGVGGGKEYNDEETLNQNGIRLVYSKFEHPVYPQLWGDFVSHLSVLDALFNCGPETREFLKNNE